MRLKSIVISFVLIVFSCSPAGVDFTPAPVVIEPIELESGTGIFVYEYLEKDIQVFYYTPANINENTPVVFTMHGGGRDAEGARDAMIDKAIQYNFIVVAPKITEADFSGGDGYNLGNVYVDGDNPSDATINPEEEWSFSIIEPLFDQIIASTESNVDLYQIAGFSAGAQFVHRFMFFKPNARYNKVVASAAGWYTVTDNNISFPYGFKNSPLINNSIQGLLNNSLFIQVGSLDNDPNAPGLRHNAYADAQGLHRLARGIHFFDKAQSIAQNNSYNINWSFTIINGIGHNLQGYSENACELIFN
ncbi:MAG: hypothetical protein ABGW56_04955 [Flavobacteriaceae bacterium]